ncbi:MAG TPA: PilN domain-containing protein [Stellaceae bacterium]|nr:PilN domain-containing protein [Stellaceae bacterium]
MTPDRLVRSALLVTQRFFHWWGAELAACIPARLRIETPWARDDLILQLGPREAVLGHDRGDGRFELEERLALPAGPGRIARDRGASVRLRLAADAALRLTIQLPQAALENLDEAVAFQLDRYTPFLPEQVYIACEAGERAAGSDTVAVAATVVERQAVADAVAQAQRLGFTVASVEVGRGEARPSPRDKAADMLPVPELRARSLGQLALAAAAIVLLVALSAAAIVLPFDREEARADALRQQLAAARGKAEAAQRLEKEIEAQKLEANFLVDRKRGRISALDVLAELTRLAPDDTWLTSAQYSGTQVQIAGLSSSSSGLIGRFEKSDILHKAEFRSPVTPDQTTGREHFAISALVGRGSAPP